MTEHQFRQMVLKFVNGQGSQRKAALTIGVSVPYLNDFIHGRRGAGPKLAGYFGLVPKTVLMKSLEVSK